MLPLAWSTNKSQPAEAAATAPIVNCTQVNVDPRHVRIVCSVAGTVVLNTVVTLPVVTLPPVTIKPPTVTVRPPQATTTVRIPGPTVRIPGPTKTVGVPGPTITVGPSELPTAASTATVTVTRQPRVSSATVEPNISDPVVDNKSTTVERVTKISLTLLAALIAALVFLYLGYILGFKDKSRKDAKFFDAIREAVLGKK